MDLLTGPALAGSDGGAGRNVAALLQRGQRALLATLILLTIAAWGLTIIQAQSMTGAMNAVIESPVRGDASNTMDEMDAMPGMEGSSSSGMVDMAGTGWTIGGLLAFVVSWAVMMAAMMLPAVAPMLLLYRTIAAKKRADGTGFVSTWILVAGYLLVWAAVGIGVYALVRLGSGVAGRVGLVGHERWAALAIGAILIVAGVYQFTPLKHACLRQCQSPVSFIMGHWRDGRSGALRMGVVHGFFCFGCCWALFAVLVAAGVMSLAWMLLLTLVVFAEKVLPYGRRTAIAIGLLLITLGALVASGVTAMPWTVQFMGGLGS